MFRPVCCLVMMCKYRLTDSIDVTLQVVMIHRGCQSLTDIWRPGLNEEVRTDVTAQPKGPVCPINSPRCGPTPSTILSCHRWPVKVRGVLPPLHPAVIHVYLQEVWVTCIGQWRAQLPVSHLFHPVGPRWLSSSEEDLSCGWLPTWNLFAEKEKEKKKRQR